MKVKGPIDFGPEVEGLLQECLADPGGDDFPRGVLADLLDDLAALGVGAGGDALRGPGSWECRWQFRFAGEAGEGSPEGEWPCLVWASGNRWWAFRTSWGPACHARLSPLCERRGWRFVGGRWLCRLCHHRQGLRDGLLAGPGVGQPA